MRDVGAKTRLLHSSSAGFTPTILPKVPAASAGFGTTALRVGLALVLFCSVLLQEGCRVRRTDDQDHPRLISATDALGRTISLRQYPRRIVSAAPSNTEILLALGLGDRLVGITDFYGSPEKAQGIQRVGGYTNPSVEKIVSLKPDIVFAARGNPMDIIEQLRRHRIVVFTLDTKTVSGLLEDIRKVAVLTGATDQAQRLTAETEKQIGIIRQRLETLSKEQKPSILWIGQEEPLRTAGPGSLVDELIRLGGGKNVAADERSPWPAYSTEKLVLDDPQVIILAEDKYKNSPDAVARTLDRFRKDSIWKNVSAIKNGRVHYIPTDMLGQPSPAFIEGLKILAQYLHPEFFRQPDGEDR